MIIKVLKEANIDNKDSGSGIFIQSFSEALDT